MRHQTTTRAGFVDLEDLICPGCGDHVTDEPAGGPRSGFTHTDATELCATTSDSVVEPVEVTW